MKMEYWHDLITEKSWSVLQKIRGEFKFILIGGWAVYLYTKSLKSKDIDIIVDFDNLNIIRKTYNLVRNDNLKKYEIKVDEIDIDIYVKNYSKFPIPVEEIEKNIFVIEGFSVVKPEILLILKQSAEFEREFSEKGQKDKIDIINLLIRADVNYDNYFRFLNKYKLQNYRTKLIKIIKTFDDLKVLNLNVKTYKNLKLNILKKLK